MNEIDKFLNAPNYYEALGLDHKSCTNEQVDRAYKKYALKFHPDKNKSPKAAQAFIKLGEIKETLKDTSKRNIYDNSVFRSDSTTTFYHEKPSTWHADENRPMRGQYRASKPTPRKRKNILLPIGAIFFLCLLISFIDNTQPFSNSITKESMAKIIKFSLDNDNSFDFTKYYSKILLEPFYIPKEWEKENILSSDDVNEWELIREQIRSYADEIYKDKLKLDCEKERKSSRIFSHPSCVRLENIL